MYINGSFFLSLKGIPLYGCAMFYFIYLPVDGIWIVSSLGPLKIKLEHLCTSLCVWPYVFISCKDMTKSEINELCGR